MEPSNAVKSGMHAGGRAELVDLDPDHPGFNDLIYRRRRDAIAALALDYKPGETVPRVEYTDVENGVWREVWENLAPMHAKFACKSYRRLADVIGLRRDRIPQLADVNAVLEPLHGFRMLPVAGLVSAKMFLSYLANGVFLSTQYIRHHSTPLYTPEPDIVHELVGHAATFADAEFCALNLAFGRAVKRNEARGGDATVMQRIGRLYWYTLEFGLVEEAGAVKCYGAGMLSSSGEMARIEGDAKLEPFDIERICETPYDPTGYQDTLFVAPDFGDMARELLAWLDAI